MDTLELRRLNVLRKIETAPPANPNLITTPKEESFLLDSTTLTQKLVTLSATPMNGVVHVFHSNGLKMRSGVDFSFDTTTNTINWSQRRLDTILRSGDHLDVTYFTLV